MKFKRKDMVDMAYDDSETLTKVEDKITSHERWSIVHSVIFKDNESGKHYRSSYSVGATEMQEQSAYESAGEEVECTEVVQKEVNVKQWVDLPE